MSFTDPFSTYQSSTGVRVGDAEREQAAEALRRHHSEGRLTDAEFEQRVSRCYAARTSAELSHLFADLPRGQRLSAPAGSFGLSWRDPHPLAYLFAGLLAVWVFSGAIAGMVGFWGPYPHPFLVPVVIAFIVWRLVVRRGRHRRGSAW